MKIFDFPLFPESASTVADEVDKLYFFSLGISAFFSLLIAGVVCFFFIKYKRQRANDTGVPVHGSLALEIVWSVIPLLITMALFAWGAKVFIDLRSPPTDAREYWVTGKQWMWKIQHPEGQREINERHVPKGQPIKLTMTSEDVIHSFFIPAFRVKQDVLPGRYSTVWFEATQTGTFHLFCAEYCGTEHSKMIGKVIVMEPEDYQTWLAGGVAQPPVVAGEALFSQYACNTCHLENDSGRGPSLHGIVGDEVAIAGGRTLERDDNYLRESILNPGAKVVAGYTALMPTFQGQVSEEGVMQLIAYIKSLDGESADAEVAATTASAPGATGAGEEAQ